MLEVSVSRSNYNLKLSKKEKSKEESFLSYFDPLA